MATSTGVVSRTQSPKNTGVILRMRMTNMQNTPVFVSPTQHPKKREQFQNGGTPILPYYEDAKNTGATSLSDMKFIDTHPSHTTLDRSSAMTFEPALIIVLLVFSDRRCLYSSINFGEGIETLLTCEFTILSSHSDSLVMHLAVSCSLCTRKIVSKFSSPKVPRSHLTATKLLSLMTPSICSHSSLLGIVFNSATFDGVLGTISKEHGPVVEMLGKLMLLVSPLFTKLNV